MGLARRHTFESYIRLHTIQKPFKYVKSLVLEIQETITTKREHHKNE